MFLSYNNKLCRIDGHCSEIFDFSLPCSIPFQGVSPLKPKGPSNLGCFLWEVCAGCYRCWSFSSKLSQYLINSQKLGISQVEKHLMYSKLCPLVSIKSFCVIMTMITMTPSLLYKMKWVSKTSSFNLIRCVSNTSN